MIFMPSSASVERVQMMRAFGADCRLASEGGMTACIAAANALAKENPNSFIPSQFDNPNNWKAH